MGAISLTHIIINFFFNILFVSIIVNWNNKFIYFNNSTIDYQYFSIWHVGSLELRISIVTKKKNFVIKYIAQFTWKEKQKQWKTNEQNKKEKKKNHIIHYHTVAARTLYYDGKKIVLFCLTFCAFVFERYQ